MNTAIELVRICFDSIMEQDLLPADRPEVQDLQNAILNLERKNLSLRTVDPTELDAVRQENIFLKRAFEVQNETIKQLREKLDTLDFRIQLSKLKGI